jgi:hypothetical protein
MTATDLSELGEAAVAAIATRGGQARLLGGIAVELLAGPRPPALRRPIEDVDIVCRRGDREPAEAALAGLGLSPDREVNALHGSERQVWWCGEDGSHLDLFLGSFRMCHELDFEDRLQSPGATLEVEDLLLTKLQIVELNEKDVFDLATLIGHGELSGERIAAVCAADWGLTTTVSDNLGPLGAMVAAIDPGLGAVVDRRSSTLLRAIEAAPKTRRWRLRAKVGRKVRWYTLPDEVVDAE